LTWPGKEEEQEKLLDKLKKLGETKIYNWLKAKK